MSLFLSRDGSAVVYVMEYVLDGKALGCKVGFSTRLRKRLTQIRYLFRCNARRDIRLVSAFETRFHREAEKRAHKILVKINGRHGEWFRVTAEEACNAVQQAILEVEAPTR